MQQKINIRRAAPGELNAILQLDRELFAYDNQFDETLDMEWTDSPEGRAFFESRISGESGVLWVGVFAKVPVAYLAAAPTQAHSYRRTLRMVELECMFVAPEHRSSGLGARMLETFLQWANDEGYERTCVTVSAQNLRARAFYERLGYTDWDMIMERALG